ncbi:ABC transporter ATP-binding protein [Deinococcus metallilatus]|uniref:ABC transporter ATP-binding protein n=1 Tax=Deinococcus metallilatus TaxID=1211322 RepID=A0AAJ5JXV2_9DEIO|nr:ABC transporter ATP-binding protein [Deinococcus metallilatus]MBB5296640.1 ATP-binding cassette subfamily B protein [Deinococcus metallilatus]QBY09269.1 ABC transporter ATP-binding protein [Deinococcus metallilatus]RXJ09790.1 ABC transporter ATP-binding protein [Deinococcus metallilatus]TLK24256.1 ABC transporter ATP-binding protein [Deinococcus metallilatus]GMA13670.1 ABC transporter ATP-binding protein [Deinococcus metallilatus]
MDSFRTFWPYLRLHGRQYLIGIVAVVIANSVNLLPYYFIRLTIDGLTRATDGNPATPGVTLAQVGLYALGILLAAVTAGALMLVMRRQIVIASRQTEYEIRRDIYANLQTLDKTFYDRSRTGDIMNRLTGDLSAVREMLGFGAWQIVNIVSGFATSFAVLFGLSWQLTLIVIAVLPVIVGLLYYLARLINQRHTRVQEQNSLIAAKAQENFSGARVVKGYAIEDREIADYRAMNLELLRRNIALTKVDGPLRAFTTLLIGLTFGVILLVGGRLILFPQGGGGFTVGKFVQFVGTLDRLAWPMMMIGWITGVTQRGLASWRRLRELLDARPQVHDEPGRTDPSIRTLRGEVDFQDVTLRYGDRTVLDHVNLHVPAGTFLGVTGPTGSGKTVLAQLITRSMDPTSGVVRIDGQDVRQIPLRVLRENISVVPQEPFLFSDTIANNIAFGLEGQDLPAIPTGVSVVSTPAPPDLPPQPDMERVRGAARLAGLAGDVENFPQGYDTVLGERGVTLSGGQRQRTAIARAIVREPRILILDDSLSAVDTETERRILDGLREVAQGRTVILIAHRVSTLRHADQIVVLDEGRVIEQGTHDELLAAGGHYAELERLQRLASDLDAEDEGVRDAEAAADDLERALPQEAVK